MIVCSLEQFVPGCDALAHSKRWPQEHTDPMHLQLSSRLPFWLKIEYMLIRDTLLSCSAPFLFIY